jgi:DNA polymerase-3 subunit delta
MQGLSLFAQQKMVVIYKPSSHKTFSEDFEKLAKQVPETTEIVIIEPKLDKRTSYYKNLKKNTNFIQFDELDETALTQWLTKEAVEKQGKITSADARYLIQRVGTNQQLLTNELEKLIIYNPQISRASIELLTEPSPQSSVFDLLEAAFAGNKKKALQLYHEQRQQKVEPLMIMGMLTWQLHVLAIVQTAGERSVSEIASEAKVNPFVVRKSQQIARNLNRSRLKELVKNLLELDVKLKSQSINADDAVSQYILDLAES